MEKTPAQVTIVLDLTDEEFETIAHIVDEHGHVSGEDLIEHYLSQEGVSPFGDFPGQETGQE